MSPEEHIFNFWMEYFIEGINEDVGEAIRFPVSLNLAIKIRFFNILIFLGPYFRTTKNLHAKFCKYQFGRRRKVHASGQLVHQLHEGQVQAKT